MYDRVRERLLPGCPFPGLENSDAARLSGKFPGGTLNLRNRRVQWIFPDLAGRQSCIPLGSGGGNESGELSSHGFVRRTVIRGIPSFADWNHLFDKSLENFRRILQ